jgi:hypothetical protein
MAEFGETFDNALNKSAGWLDPLADGSLVEPILEFVGAKEPANYRYKGLVFSKEETHSGNSVITYGESNYGTIQRIVVTKGERAENVLLSVKPYLPYSDRGDGEYSHVSRYAPDFPAAVMSTEQGEETQIQITDVKCHCARYHISKRVILLVALLKVSPSLCFVLQHNSEMDRIDAYRLSVVRRIFLAKTSMNSPLISSFLYSVLLHPISTLTVS